MERPFAYKKEVKDEELPYGKQNFDNLTEKEQEDILKAEEIYKMGLVSIRDIIAPSAMQINPDHLRLNDKYARTLFVFTYPRYLTTGWFSSIVNLNEELDISFYITPVSSESILKTLKSKVGQIRSTISAQQEKGEVRDPMLETALNDVEELRDRLVQGTERFFHFALYMTIYAENKKELQEKTKEIEGLLGHKLVYSKRTVFQMEEGFNSTMPLGNDEIGVVNSMNTSPLSTTFPFVSSELTSDEGILYGINRHNNSLIIFDRFTLPNANSVVFAIPGAGKSIAKDETVLIKDNNNNTKIVKIGNLVEKLIKEKGRTYIDDDLEGVIDPNILVYTFNKNLKGEWSKVSAAARKKADKYLYQFKTQSGRKIKVTKDHNMLVLKNGQVITLKSEDIKNGQYVPLPRTLPEPQHVFKNLNLLELLKNNDKIYIDEAANIINKNYTRLKKAKLDSNFDKYLYKYRLGHRLPIKYFHRILKYLNISLNDPQLNFLKVDSSRHKKRSNQKINLFITSEFLRLLGYITSEGTISKNFVFISNRDSEVLKDIRYCLDKLKISFFDRKDGIMIAHRVFTEINKALGTKQKSRQKQVPPLIYNLSNKNTAQYLKAYFEGDGGVEHHSVNACSASLELISHLSYLLFRYSIVTRISKRIKRATNSGYKGTYYLLTISGANNLSAFAKNIGFISKKKNQRLNKILGKKPNTNVDLVPGVSYIINEIYDLLPKQLGGIPHLSRIRSETFKPSRELLKEFIDNIEKRINKIEKSRLRFKKLEKLPSLSAIIEIAKTNLILNNKLWEKLGESWRLMKNQVVNPGCKNVFKAIQEIFSLNYELVPVKQEIKLAFQNNGLQFKKYNQSFQTFLTDRPDGDGSYKTLKKSIDYLSQEYAKTISKIEEAKRKLYLLKNLANSDLFWDPISEIKKIKCRDKYVYDLTVDNEVFLAGQSGLFVHNSYAVKLEILRSLMFGSDLIVVDPENEYKHLCDAAGGTFLRISLDSDYRLNPFDLPPGISGMSTEDIIRSAVINLKGLMRLMLGRLTKDEDALVDKALIETYAKKDITPESDLNKITSPTMQDFQEILETMEGAEDLVGRVKKYTEGTFAGLFNQPTNVEMKAQFVVFSIRDIEEELRPIAMYVVLNYIWNVVRAELKRRVLVVDEAWWMMQYEDSARFMYSMAKRGRKYYLGLTTISQDVADFLNSDHGKAVVTNSSMMILLKQSPANIDLLKKTFYLTDEEKYLLLESDVGEGIFFAGPKHVAIKIVASYMEDQLITTDPKQLLEIEKSKEELEETAELEKEKKEMVET